MAQESVFRTVGTKGRLVDRVVLEIQASIIDGRLRPGTKLPPERDLAEELGVSRTVVREAVRILVTKGLLETTHGVGTVVRQVTRDQVVEPLNLLLQAHDVTVDDLHQVRSILEVEIAGLAARQATAEDVAEVKQILDEMEAARDNPEEFAAKDADFHRGLAKITHNPLLIVLLDSIRDLMQEVRLRVNRYPGLAEQVIPDHYTILEKVTAKDPAGARQAMQKHLEMARRIQQAVMEEGDS